MFDLFSKTFSAVFVLSFLASFGMSPESSIDENIITSMKIGAICAVVICLCVNWREYNG